MFGFIKIITRSIEMKKKSLMISIVALSAAVVVGMGIALAWVIISAKTDKNDITIGSPTYITIGGAEFADTIMPNGTVEKAFTYNFNGLTFAGGDYVLEMNGMTFVDDQEAPLALTFKVDPADNDETAKSVWSWSIDGGTSYTALASAAAVKVDDLTSSDTGITLTIKLHESLTAAFAGGKLSFYLEIKAK
jgi:hypothetical protein